MFTQVITTERLLGPPGGPQWDNPKVEQIKKGAKKVVSRIEVLQQLFDSLISDRNMVPSDATVPEEHIPTVDVEHIVIAKVLADFR